MERRAIAMIPANTPGPRMETSNKDQINELMEREETMINKATGRSSAGLGEVLRAARKATGTASTKASRVPSVAIFKVSQRGSQSLSMYSHRGGTILEPISAAMFGASSTKNHSVFSETSCQHQTNSAVPKNQSAQWVNCVLRSRCFQIFCWEFISTGITELACEWHWKNTRQTSRSQ